MTEREIRHWLERARTINREIVTLYNTKKEARDQVTRTTQNYQSDGAQSSRNPHKYDRLVELESLIDQKVDELLSVKAEIIKAIGEVPDGRHRCVLLGYFVDCLTLEEVAVQNHYSYRSVKRYLRGGIFALSQSPKMQNLKI